MAYVFRCPQKLRILRYVTSPLTSLHWYRHFFRFDTNYTQLSKYRRLLKLKVRVLVEQNLHGHAR